MLLQALNEFYERATQGDEPLMDDPAFSPKGVRWVIPLDEQGNLLGVGVIDTLDEKKRPREFKRAPRTSRPKKGKVADFLAEEFSAVFGLPKDLGESDTSEKKLARQAGNLRAKHEDFWRQIREAHETISDPAFAALLNFAAQHRAQDENAAARVPSFLRWGVAENAKEEKPAWLVKTASDEEVKLSGENFTFEVSSRVLIEEETVQNHWRNAYAGESGAKSVNGLCLVTGNTDVPIMASHYPKIKGGGANGVPGATSTGATLISFDKDSFTSYGFNQSYNAPISSAAVTAYTNALNWLLRETDYSLRIGNTKLCFWARESDTRPLMRLLDRPRPESVQKFLRSPRIGDADLPSLKHDRFYSVMLSGNAGRVVVRHWMQTSVAAAVESIRQWFEDLHVVSFASFSEIASEDVPPLKIIELVKATGRKSEDAIAETETQLYRASLDKDHVPSLNIAALILRRLKADLSKFGVSVLETPIPYATMKKMRETKYPVPPAGESRFALLKLILNRNAKKRGELMIKPEVFETDDIPYNCGRLLAVFSLLQKAAHRVEADGKRREFGGAGVVERYYGAASAAPNRTFAILWKLHHNHLQKLGGKGESGRRAVQSFEKRIEEIVSRLPHTTFQSSFKLQEQGRFALGFYQQKAFERQQLNERIAARKAQQQSDVAKTTSAPDEVDLDELLNDE